MASNYLGYKRTPNITHVWHSISIKDALKLKFLGSMTLFFIRFLDIFLGWYHSHHSEFIPQYTTQEFPEYNNNLTKYGAYIDPEENIQVNVSLVGFIRASYGNNNATMSDMSNNSSLVVMQKHWQ